MIKKHFNKKKRESPSSLFKEHTVLYFSGIGGCLLLFIGLIHYLTAYYNYNYMLKTEEQSLFLYTYDFFYGCMQKAGGLLTYGGCFLTQFFYYPQLGSLIYIALLLLIVFLTLKVFCMPWHFFPLAFLPSLMLLVSYTNLGYLLFVLKSPGYVFSNPLGVCVSLSAFWIYRLRDKWSFRSSFVLLYVVFTYPLFGFYTLFGGLLCILHELISYFASPTQKRIYPLLAGGVSLVGFPYLYFRYLYTRMSESDIYTSSLPRFYSGESELSLWMPFILLFSILLLFLLLKQIKIGQKKRIWCAGLSFLIFGLCVGQIYRFSYDDDLFRTELEMDLAISRNDWNRVLNVSAALDKEPTRLIVMYRNLALQKLGIAGDKMFHYKNGVPSYAKSHSLSNLRILGARSLYYQYGALNFCYRWCMEDAVETGWKVDYLKTMAKCALLNKEFPLAGKYLHVLKQTKYHKKWANEYELFLHNPSLMEQNKEFSEIKPYTEFHDVLDGDGGLIEGYLLHNFARMEGGPMELIEVSLQSNLILKNTERFWPRFMYYIQNNERIPVHYQEAALLYSYLERRVDVSNLKLDSQIIARFNELIKRSKEYAHKGEEYCKVAFSPSYGNTFWYYYFFING